MTEAEIRRSLERAEQLGPFKVKPFDFEPGKKPRLDAVLRLSLDGKSKDFAVEVSARSVTRDIRERAVRVRDLAKRVGGNLQPMVVSPYIRPDLARELLEMRVSAVDLCGNVAVVVPRTWYVERLGSPNLYPESKPLKNPFRGTSSLVARTLAKGERFASAKDLVARIEELGGSITKSTVSKVLSVLVDEGLAEREPEIRATDRVRLVEKLAENFRSQVQLTTKRGTVEQLQPWLVAISERARERGVRLAGYAPERYADFPSSYKEVRIYSDDLYGLLNDSEFREDDRWPNVTVVTTDDPTVYFDLETRDRVRWCPPLEAYLTLQAGGKRDRDTAEGLLVQVLGEPETSGTR